MSEAVKTIFVKPGKSLERVPNPNCVGRYIENEGLEVVKTPGIMRFLKTGELVETKRTAAKKKKPAAPASDNKPE